jgi:polyphosphate kinase 2
MAKYLSEFYTAPQFIDELELLQIEMVKMLEWVQVKKKRVAILFEGRDAAGKGGAIFRLTQFLNPRAIRVVALPKPTKLEKGQWYFQRYIQQLPNPGEIVFFDRSWYNRALVEPVMGFCSEKQHNLFMKQVSAFEQMLIDDGMIIFKLWFSISVEEQKKRLTDRSTNPLKQWKLSTVDLQAQQKWERFTEYKQKMFNTTSTDQSPWISINGNTKEVARIQAMKYVLSRLNYTDKADANLLRPNPDLIHWAHQ